DDTPLRVVPVDIDREQLDRALSQHKPAAIYVTPMRAVSVKDIAESAAGAQATTMTGVPRYIESGMAVSVRLLDARPKLMLNVSAATAQGAQFSSDLLRLAQVRK
ncbi:MAG TPA: YfiR/HmsC family protein, partial [Gemmatimonadaceae bacterium]|nr:YfiR/HmsC family protein [Gemmatimonadaceae bacterium]